MAKSFKDIPAAAQAAILIVVAFGIAAGLFYYGIPGVMDSVWGLKEKQDRLKIEVAKLKAENDKNEAFRQQKAEYELRIKQNEAKLETLRLIVPEEQATDEFMRSVYDLGVSTNVYVRTFVARDLVPREFYIEMPFTMRLDGTYYSLLSFFTRLRNLQRIVSVNVMGLTLGAPQGGGMGAYQVLANETVGANCTITTYFNKPPAAAQPKK